MEVRETGTARERYTSVIIVPSGNKPALCKLKTVVGAKIITLILSTVHPQRMLQKIDATNMWTIGSASGHFICANIVRGGSYQSLQGGMQFAGASRTKTMAAVIPTMILHRWLPHKRNGNDVLKTCAHFGLH